MEQELEDGVYEGAGLIRAEAGEFLCPTCRRISNTVLPALVSEPGEAERGGSPESAATSYGVTAPSSQDKSSTGAEGRASTDTKEPEAGAGNRDVNASSVKQLIADAQAALEGFSPGESTEKEQGYPARGLEGKEPAHLHPGTLSSQMVSPCSRDERAEPARTGCVA